MATNITQFLKIQLRQLCCLREDKCPEVAREVAKADVCRSRCAPVAWQTVQGFRAIYRCSQTIPQCAYNRQ